MKYLFIITLIIFSSYARGQYVSYGTDPAHLKWKTFSTPHYKLIFPASCDSAAYRYASFLEKSYPYIGNTIGKSVISSFPVVLHPGNMLSNGAVIWAPRRMELFTTPSSNLIAQSWDKHLVLHESRHIMQMKKFSQGIFKPLNYILGEQNIGIATFATPKWFLEGDAVMVETAMSNSGRGRLPEFNIIYRAHMLSDKFFSYDKWALGSYKDYTGNFYALGYNMTSYARYRYGSDIWNKVSSRYTRRFFNIPPFSKALKYHTGANTESLFNQTFSFLKEEWLRQDSISDVDNSINYLTPQYRKYTSYKSPQALDNSFVVAVKTSLDDINSLVAIINNKEVLLSRLGNINSHIVLNGDRVYWTEYVTGMRWTHENYSDLKCFDLTSGKIINITSKQRYLSPSINKTGEIAIVSEPSFSGKNMIVIVDTKMGIVLKKYAVPKNGFVKETAFINEDEIAAIVNDDDGISILKLNVKSGKWSGLLKPTSANITSLTAHNDKLYFESGLNGTNNIFVLDTSTSECSRLTTSQFGAFTPSISQDGKNLFFTDYTVKGNRIAYASIKDLQKKPADFKNVYSPVLAEAIAQQEEFNLDKSDYTADDIKVYTKPYRKIGHLFRVHSWMPFYFDAADAANSLSDDLTAIAKPGAMLLSQNTLSTMMTQVGWFYDKGYHHGKLALSYSGLYPVLDLNVEYGNRTFIYNWGKDEADNITLTYNRTNSTLVDADARMYVPINLSRNHYISGIQPSITYSFTNNKYQHPSFDKFSHYQFMVSELRYYRYRKLAHQDILPRFGYQIRLQYLNVPFETRNFGSLYAAGITTYLPGFIRGHGLMLRTMYQYQDLEGKAIYIPQKLINQARGYSYNYVTRHKAELKVDYSFSLLCPDLSIKGLAYVKRIRSNVFFDYSKNQKSKHSGWTTHNSYGADLIFDCNLLRLSYPMSIGARTIIPINYGKVQAEALFSVSF
jgi:hypothetical protein